MCKPGFKNKKWFPLLLFAELLIEKEWYTEPSVALWAKFQVVFSAGFQIFVKRESVALDAREKKQGSHQANKRLELEKNVDFSSFFYYLCDVTDVDLC